MATEPKQSRPPLEDPLNEREIFVSDVVAVGNLYGNIGVTLATIRFDDATPPKPHRIVCARLVLTPGAASALLNSLQQLATRSVEVETPPAPREQPN